MRALVFVLLAVSTASAALAEPVTVTVNCETPHFIPHELLHNFGCRHGDEMSHRQEEAMRRFEA